MEETSETKHDYLEGRILDMVGGTTNHNSICSNLIREFGQALKGTPCRVFGSDQRLQVRQGTLYTYPDAQIVCGEPQYVPGDRGRAMITNPKVVFEVLSRSTEAYDRGDKFVHYVALDSLTEYVLISQWTPRVEVFHRRGDGTWLLSWADGLDATLHVPSVDVRLPLAEIYRDVDFDGADRRRGRGGTARAVTPFCVFSRSFGSRTRPAGDRPRPAERSARRRR